MCTVTFFPPAKSTIGSPFADNLDPPPQIRATAMHYWVAPNFQHTLMGYFVIKNAENKIVDSPGFMDFAALYILQIIITLKSNLLKDNKMFFEEFLKKIENPKKNNIETHLKDYYKKTSQSGILILNTDTEF
jgi:hypothetical protein